MRQTNFPPPGFVKTGSAVDGITVYVPDIEVEEAAQEVIDFVCPNCHATMAFSARDGGVTCRNCGYYEPPQKDVVGRAAEEFEFKVETVKAAAHGWGEAKKELKCGNCQATTIMPSAELSISCPFCGSNKVVQGEAGQDNLRPRFLIPFRLEREQIIPIASGWLGASWMLPGQLRRMAKLGDFRGVYLPFWTFDALTQAAYRCEVGYDETERYYSNGEWQTRTVTKWRWKNGNVSVPFDDLLVSGTTHITQGILDTISPFNMNELAPYEATYLAGWAAQAYEVLLEKAWDVGREEMRAQTRRSAETNALAGGGDRIRNMNIGIEFSNESWRYILLPVYLAPFQYDGEPYQVVINGQSGAIGGRRPISWPKVISAILALFLPVPFFGLLALLFPPVGCLAALSLAIAIAVGLNILSKARKISNPDNKTPELLQGAQLW